MALSASRKLAKCAFLRRAGVATPPARIVGCRFMGDPAAQLRAVGAANEELHETAKQALEWVRVSEARVAKAEARSEELRAELKQRAMATLRKLGVEGRERIAAERRRRKEAEARATRAEAARDRAELSFEQIQAKAEGEREAIAKELSAVRAGSERALAKGIELAEGKTAARHKEALDKVRLEADRRVAAAEQRAVEAEAAAAEAHQLAVKLETEIEERVMQGTEEVRREADERVRTLVEKVEGDAAEKARTRAEEALKAESERIRAQAEQREDRVRRAAEDEIKASTSRARREVLAAAEKTAPSWERREAAASGSGYRTF